MWPALDLTSQMEQATIWFTPAMGFKNGELKSAAERLKYSTSADIGSYWNNLNTELEAIPINESDRAAYSGWFYGGYTGRVEWFVLKSQHFPMRQSLSASGDLKRAAAVHPIMRDKCPLLRKMDGQINTDMAYTSNLLGKPG